MKQLHEVVTSEDYFAYFDQQLKAYFEQNPGSQIEKFYQNLCALFQEHIQHMCADFFNTLKQLLSLDAQLQLLVEWVTTIKFENIGYSEDEILKLIQIDKNSYYRELFGMTKNQRPPWNLMCLSEWHTQDNL